MIKIKDYIFNENEIIHIGEVGWSEARRIEVITKNNKIYYIDDIHIRDIEWNYGKDENNKLKEDNRELIETNMKLAIKNKELEEENNELKELNVCVGCDNNPDYKSRILKAIEYIIERYDYQGHALTHTFDKDNVRELLKILKGEKNE